MSSVIAPAKPAGLSPDGPFIDPFREGPLRDAIFGQAYLEQYARELAQASQSSLTHPVRSIDDRLREDEQQLRAAHTAIREASRGQETLSPDAEWLLDNYFVVEDVLREVKRDLPAGYYQELPRLTVGPLAGYPRILALALGLIAHSDSSLNETQIREMVRAYQSIRQLTIGELWAIPTMLRLGLLENLRRLSQQMIATRDDREYAARWVAGQIADVRAGQPVAEPERRSDAALVGILQGLRDHGSAAQPIVAWLEEWLARDDLTLSALLRRENRRQAANQVSVGNCITSLRLLNALDWNTFVEQTSLVEAELRSDPTGVYPRQDFQTRDRCRQAIERLARGSDLSELEVTHKALALARAGREGRRQHVAYFLLDRGRSELERAIQCRPPLRDRQVALLRNHPNATFFGLLALVLAALLALVVVLAGPGSWDWAIGVIAAALLPASEIAVGLVNFIITKLLPPRVLTKLEAKDGIPADCGTFVVMPSMLLRADSARNLLERLELHYLANPDSQLRFALLTDFADAPEETQPTDAVYLKSALDGVAELNRRHAGGGPDIFFVFHRKRQWNESEGRWMGWERKRGKLLEFNRLLRGAADTSYTTLSGPLSQLPFIRFVITLDADTNLPRETARRMICTLAHPLNRARLNPDRTRVVEGYGILQPRVSFLYQTGTRSRFARILANSAGIDPYQTAVSDVYMDLFGSGSFVGKGMYDVDAFEAVTGPAFPDNAILSHDLIESNFARCGLATDIELLDDFPPRYHAYARREHRWVRGDWQLLPWLGPTTPAAGPGGRPTRRRNVLGLAERWKVFDNLRRSLVAPAVVLMLLLGWTVLPGSPWLWTTLAAMVAGVPLILLVVNSLWDAARGPVGAALRAARGSIPATAAQAALSLGFLLDQARINLDAIGVTLGRLFFTRKHLLEWETAAATEQRLSNSLAGFARTMGVTSGIALLLLGIVALGKPAALPAALPLLAFWLLSPVLAFWVSQPLKSKPVIVTAEDRKALRRIARKTWHFFETFVGPEDNWLPPDNFQEFPKGEIAHRTSPTNKGLLLLSTLAAYDFGYVSLSRCAERLGYTVDTLEKLEKFHGHILNWYDTRSLVPLQPGYVSTVDSGNLLASLIALKNGLLEAAAAPVPAAGTVEGLADTLTLAEEALHGLELLPAEREPLASRLRQIAAKLLAPPADLPAWHAWISELAAAAAALPGHATALAEKDASGDLARWTGALGAQISDLADELNGICPWARMAPQLAKLAVPPELAAIRDDLMAKLTAPAGVADWVARLPGLKANLARLRSADGATTDALAAALDASTAPQLLTNLRRLAERSAALAAGMDFRFLYNPERNLFSIGYNLAVGRLDNAHYDLLASEARIASFLAVARGEVPRKHWFQLGRPLTVAAGSTGLLSWGGTMFEYLMPRLVLPTFAGTLLDQAERTAVARQIEFGRANGVPWGVSESGFYVLDAFQIYQYQSFGVPGLGLKRGLQNDVVIAPYAALMAVVVAPHEVRTNLNTIRDAGGEGPFGVYEAIDYTRRRLPPDKRCQVVRQYMAHHQGMAFVALANELLGNAVPRWLRAEAVVRANELLLQERMPTDAPTVVPPEDDESTRRAALTVQMPTSRRITTADTPSPRTHILSNGQYTVMLTNAGGGFSTCRDLDVTRWREDRTRDFGGHYIYVRNTGTGRFWSVADQPCGGTPDRYEVTFSIDKVDYRRQDGDIETYTEITVSPERNVEVRRITLTNHGRRAVELDVTSYVELALVSRGADLAHPAFQKLFLETDWVPAQRALLCRRRPRSPQQQPVWAVHTVATEGRSLAPPTFETDRARFLGRRRTPSRPAALDPGANLTGATGPVLDPIFSLRQRVKIEPGASAGLAFTTAVADTRADALGLADQYNAFHAVLRVFDLAWAQSRVELRDLHVTVEESHQYQRLAGMILFPAPHLRASADVIRANRQPQSGLWKFGISGDLPILLVAVKDADELGVVRQLVLAHTFWRTNGLSVDLVILNEHPSGYLEMVQEQILNIVKTSDANAFFDRPGGVFIRKADQMAPEDRTLLFACARVVLYGERGPLADQLDLPERVPAATPLLRPDPAAPRYPAQPLAPRPDLVLVNGLGGFTRDGHEYVITYDPAGAGTPAPWSNVVANANAGFLITEAGGGFTWAANSQANRLTPWGNDPVTDAPGEAVYVRDELTGEFWSVTALPVPNPTPVRARHGQGYTTFERNYSGLEHELRLHVPTDDPVKISRLRITNRSGSRRRLSAAYFAEWVLGTVRETTAIHVVTEIDPESGALLARNAYNPEHGSTVAFADVSLRPRTLTGDRTEFIGRNGGASNPAGLAHTELSNRIGAGLDPCAAFLAPFDLAPDAQIEIVFVLGQASDADAARRLAVHYRDPGRAEHSFRDAVAAWDQFLDAVSVRTPDDALNHLVNRWLPYQVLACRFWGRSAFYQSGGAFGYRDQLQDSMALVHGRPDLAREHLLRAAAHQFPEGDALHWWHPPSDRGVRTRFSDDYLWLPFCTAFYVATTGDAAVLDEPVGFVLGPELTEGQDENYIHPTRSTDTASLYDHCTRALDRAGARGDHGLPLMGCGDWNDGMNMVGHDGKGESVWLAWFLADTYRRFAELSAGRNEAARAAGYRKQADELVAAIDQSAWDGAWYRRAYFDDGTPLGSATNDECQIDSLPQSWAVITGGGEPERARRAMDAVEERLIGWHDRLVLLFTPPFDHGPLQPGYIKGYVPGIRENGGQYTHAAIWVLLAHARLGRGEAVAGLLDLLNPVHLTETPERLNRYKVEPYVIAADVYGRSPHIGRGGWTWYTGSASWFWRVITEAVLGVERRGHTLTVNPCIPAKWGDFEVVYRFGRSRHVIKVENPAGVETGVKEMFLDGAAVTGGEVELVDDGRDHTIRVVMG